jgi:hypothetical protein
MAQPIAATISESPPMFAAITAVLPADPVISARLIASGTFISGLFGKYFSAM